MRSFKIVGAALMALLAVTAVATATASAALPEILPGSGTFTATSGAGTLETTAKEKITCKSDTSKGTITNVKEGTFEVDFKECTALGFAANSLGDPAQTILVTGTLLLCYINRATKDVGVVIHLPTAGIHIEVPSLGALILVTGWVIGLIEPVNSKKTGPFTLSFKQAAGKQEFTKCEGGATEVLKSSKNEGAAVESGEETIETVTFAAEHEIMA
jgi:hypothetical protein